MRLQDLPGFDVRPLLRQEREDLLTLLGDLASAEWQADTVCPGWSVKDICLHVLGEDLVWLAAGRDGDAGGLISHGDDYRAFVAALNEKNQRWVEATRGLSPWLIRELLAFTGPLVDEWHSGLNLDGTGRVAWTGPEPVPMWFDIAQDLTERWVHQQQIRDAVARPGLDDATYLHPILRTFIWALPHHYREVDALPGAQLGVDVTGPGGGRWTLTRWDQGWELDEQPAPSPAATVTLESDAAWRLFTGALPDPGSVQRDGPDSITAPFLAARGIIG